MALPDKDVAFLREREYEWEVVPDPAGSFCVVVRRFAVDVGGFTPSETDLMIRVPSGYPMTPLDMWYCDPPIRIQSTGQFATASDVFEDHIDRRWQRFSRHLNGRWRPGVDGLRSFFALIQRELQGLGKQ